MAKNVYLQFQINLTDRALVADLQGTPFNTTDAVGAIIVAPDTAAVTYSAPVAATRVAPVAPPSITSEYFDTADHFPTNVRTFDRKEGGWFGVSWLFGTKVHYYWRGVFVYQPSTTVTTDSDGAAVVEPADIPDRRWIDGFELPSIGEGNTGTGNEVSREASRHVDGYGLMLSASTSQRGHSVNENYAIAPKKSWERFYYRRRNAPAGQAIIWSCKGTIEGTAGVGLMVLPSGQLSAIKIDNVGVVTTLATTPTPLTVHVWYKVDLLIEYAPAAGIGGSFRVYLNGVAFCDINSFPAGTNLGLNTATHSTSALGSGIANTLISNYDDWSNMNWPIEKTPIDPANPQLRRTSLDWLNGTAIVPIRPRGDSASRAGWTGDWRVLQQLPVMITPQVFVSSSTAGARLAVTTDVAESVLARPGLIGNGIVAMMVARQGQRNASSGNGSLGWTIGGADTLAAIVEATGSDWRRVFYHSTLTVPMTPTGLELVYLHGTGAFANFIAALQGCAEVVGAFGPEDVIAGAGDAVDVQPANLGPHNAPYPHSPWARAGVAPPAPVSIKSGTYVGTGTSLDLAFRQPIHWLRIRPLTGDTGGVRWFSSMMASHKGLEEGIGLNPMISEVLIDPTYVPTTPALPAGSHADVVTTIKADLVARGISLVGDCGAFEITKRVAWQMRAVGLGLQFKNVGANCSNYAPAIIMDAAGNIVDILGDAGGLNTPQWSVGVPISPLLYRAAIDPGDGDADPTLSTEQVEQTIVRITGNDAQINAVGVTYQYTAFADPGMRFCVCGAAVDHRMSPAADMVSALHHATFLPLAGFLHKEVITTSTAAAHFYKGPGHATSAASPVSAAETASAIAFAAGQLTIKSGFGSATYSQYPYALFRRDDLSGDPGVPRVCCLTSYVGDGAASRTIALLPASGKRPVYALVIPHNAAAVERDASHTGTTSTTLPATANPATGITGGGIDTLSVGSALNTNAIIYDVFVFFGSDVAGNGGFSPAGDFDPVAPSTPVDGPWTPDDTIDPADTGPVAPVEPDTPTPPAAAADDFGTSCRAASEVLINLALARIGQNEQVSNVVTDTTAAAAAGRLHFNEAVQTTLRDFPWPFATKYSTLTLVAGSVASPVNRDWTYSYRRPNDCVFERRIVVARAGALDPTSPAFQLSSDSTGGLIFTNEAAARLEYTARPVCAASTGDPLFREALVCRLAASMAPALARIENGTAAMVEQYVQAIAKAEQVLRPGNPGTRAADFTGDTGTGCMAANVAVVNRALLRIGARTIASLTTDQSQSATAARLIFEDELLSVLRDFPWPFATVYDAALTLVGGTTTVPVNADWQYSYRLPAGATFVRRLVRDGTGRIYDANPPTFKLGRDATGALLYTNEEIPILEYTYRPDCAVKVADPLFRDALAWRLAASLAPSLAQPDPDTPEQVGRGPDPMTKPRVHPTNKAQMRLQVQRFAWAMYQDALAQARVAAANESEREPPGDASWITERN